MIEIVKQFDALVTVGASSFELSTDNNVKTEEGRADRRAEQIQLWIKDNVATSAPIYTLSMGRYKNSTPDKQSYNQRILVILGIADPDKGFDFNSTEKIKELLKNSLINVAAFPFKIEEYTRFELKNTRNTFFRKTD